MWIEIVGFLTVLIFHAYEVRSVHHIPLVRNEIGEDWAFVSPAGEVFNWCRPHVDVGTTIAGSLVVVARRTQFMYISLVTVKLDNAELPQKMKDVMQDNVDALRNALSSVGIVPDIREFSINVKTSEIRQFKDGAKWDYEKKVDGKQLDEVFVKKYADLCKTNPVLKYRNVVFLFPAFFYDNCAAYASSKLLPLPRSEDKLSFVVESRSFSCDRFDCYQIAHELLHRLEHPHNFQLFHILKVDNVYKKVQTTPYCFPIPPVPPSVFPYGYVKRTGCSQYRQVPDVGVRC